MKNKLFTLVLLLLSASSQGMQQLKFDSKDFLKPDEHQKMMQDLEQILSNSARDAKKIEMRLNFIYCCLPYTLFQTVALIQGSDKIKNEQTVIAAMTHLREKSPQKQKME